MLDDDVVLLALRARATGTTPATTGSTTLSATATGYARASGSFLTDGFRVGMEITTVTGFSVSGNNQSASVQGRVVTEVTALSILCSGCSVDASASGRTITAGVPFVFAYEDVTPSSVPQGFPYIEEEIVPATNKLRSFPASNGSAEDDGLYILRVYSKSNTGGAALRRYAKTILARFTPGTQFALSDGTTLRIPTQFGPKRGQITRTDQMRSYISLEIPYVGESINAIV